MTQEPKRGSFTITEYTNTHEEQHQAIINFLETWPELWRLEVAFVDADEVPLRTDGEPLERHQDRKTS